jgi:hypothetical protein
MLMFLETMMSRQKISLKEEVALEENEGEVLFAEP